MFQSSASARDAAWLDAKTLSRPLDSPTRKRQRPDAAGPALDLKLEFAGFELVHSADPAVHSADPHSNLLLEAAAALLARVAPAAAQNPLVLENLSRDGFDSAAALAFAAPDELARAGLSPADASAVASTARQRVAVALAPPPPLSSPSTVSHWLMQCGIPDQSAFQYAEKLCRLGYASPPELELVLHDARAISSFRLGHGRLFLHCVAAAVHALQLQTQRMLLAPVQHVHDHNVQPLPFASSSAMLTPVDLQRESELDAQVYDGFLDALMDHDDDHSDHSDHDMLGMQTDPFMAAMAAPMAASMPSTPLRMPPPEHMSLLHEAVNQPRPNACRRGKKIYWSVLATNGLKDPRFAPLAAYSAKELQTAYVTQFEPHAMISSPPAVQHSPVPSTAVASAPAAKPDAWSEENIKQLERAVKDPRCRHLSKVCWEMLATGRTGVDEYAPLAKFSASQLRSRFRSLFGDKRPQKLRQKKQMQKLQQQQAQQAQQAQQQLQVKKEESVAL